LSEHIAFAGTRTDEPVVTQFLIVDMLNAEAAAVLGRTAAEVLGIADEHFTIHYEGPAASFTETQETFEEARRARNNGIDQHREHDSDGSNRSLMPRAQAADDSSDRDRQGQRL
jgi:hypothetical protein